MLRNPLVISLVSILIVALGLFLALVVIDPFGVWPTKLSSGFFNPKAERINTVRLGKAYDLLRNCPDDVITGMSTVVWGIDPDDYPRKGYSLYNGGIVGSTMEEQYYYLKHYLNQCPNIGRIYLDLNAETFRERPPQRDFVPERLTEAVMYPPDLIFTSFSSSAILASARTVTDAYTGRVNRMLYDSGNGFHFHPSKARDEDRYKSIVRFLTLDKTHSVIRVSKLQISYLRQLVHELKKRNIELVAFFGPISQVLFAQAEQREVLPVRPGENMYFDIRRQIAEITSFWDFGLNNNITGDDISHTKHFFDQIHYFPTTGTAVLAAVNGRKDPSLPDNFAVYVTQDNINDHIERLKQGNIQWRQQFPHYYQMISDHYGKLKVNEEIPNELF